jgi:hypothetical protein
MLFFNCKSKNSIQKARNKMTLLKIKNKNDTIDRESMTFHKKIIIQTSIVVHSTHNISQG